MVTNQQPTRTEPGKKRSDPKKGIESQNESDYNEAGSPGMDVETRTAPDVSPGNYSVAYAGDQESILEEVRKALMGHEHIDAHDFDISVEDGIVTLKGTIEDLEKKRMAEEAILGIQGVNHVHNELRIGSPETEGYGEQGRADYSGNPTLRSGHENQATHGDESGTIH